MSLVWCDGFDGQTVKITGTPYVFSDGSSGGITYVTGRLGGSAISTTSVTNNSQYRLQKNLTAASTYVTGVAIKPSSTAYSFSASNRYLMVAFALGATAPLRVVYDMANAKIQVWNTGTMLQEAPMTLDVWHYLEVKALAATTASGTVTVKLDGATVLSQTGINWGVANWDSISLLPNAQGIPLPSNITGGSSYQIYYDDWYINNTSGSKNNDFLGDIRVANLVPTGAGSSTQLTPSAGSNWQCVDEVPPSSTDYVGSSTVGQIDLYAMSDLPAGSTNVFGLQVNAFAAKSDTGAISGRALAKSGGTTANGSDAALSVSYQVLPTIMENDPSGAAWTPTSLNAAEFGWEVRA